MVRNLARCVLQSVGKIMLSANLEKRGGAYGINGEDDYYCRILIRHDAYEVSDAHQEVLVNLKKRKFTDCIVICGQEETPCHRVVLASASPVFEKMLNTDMKESLERRIDIGKTEPKYVRSMLNSIYKGVMDVEDTNDVPQVMSLAHRYECTRLATECAESLVDTVDAHTIQDVVRHLRLLRQEPTFREVWKKLIAKVKGSEDFIVQMMDKF